MSLLSSGDVFFLILLQPGFEPASSVERKITVLQNAIMFRAKVKIAKKCFSGTRPNSDRKVTEANYREMYRLKNL